MTFFLSFSSRKDRAWSSSSAATEDARRVHGRFFLSRCINDLDGRKKKTFIFYIFDVTMNDNNTPSSSLPCTVQYDEVVKFTTKVKRNIHNIRVYKINCCATTHVRVFLARKQYVGCTEMSSSSSS